MPEFLHASLLGNTPVHWLDVVVRLVTAVILGLGVTWLYRVCLLYTSDAADE